MCFSKFILFVTNVILFIVGVVVIVIASGIIYKGNEYGELFLEGELTLPIIILIAGIFIVILGFLGFAGILKESKYMLYTYAVIMLGFFFAEVVLAISVLKYPGATKKAFETFMDKQFKKYGGKDDALTELIDKLQCDKQCCGVRGSDDWKTFFKNESAEIPASCICQSGEDDNYIKTPGNSLNHYKEGCVDAIMEHLYNHSIALGIFALILAFVMFFSMTTACGLAKKSNYK